MVKVTVICKFYSEGYRSNYQTLHAHCILEAFNQLVIMLKLYEGFEFEVQMDNSFLAFYARSIHEYLDTCNSKKVQ